MLQQHIKTKKTDKTRFFFAEKQFNLLPDKQLYIKVPFQSTRYRKKRIACVYKEVQETSGDVFCPTCRNEEFVYISTNKTSIFYDCKKCKAGCHIQNNPFKYPKPRIMLFGGKGTHCFVTNTSYE